MSRQLEIAVLEFGEVNDSDRPRVEKEVLCHYMRLLDNYPAGPIAGSVEIRNIGKGADWPIVILAIGGLFFTIPEATRKVRDSLEEWRRIFKEFQEVMSWILGKKRAIYPDQYLFLVGLFAVAARVEPDALTFLGLARLPEDNPDLSNNGPLLFSFAQGGVIYQVTVGRNGQVLWDNEFSVSAIETTIACNSKSGRGDAC